MKHLRLLLIPIAAIGYRLRGSAGKGGWVEKLTGIAIGTFFGRWLWCIPVALMASHNIGQFMLVAMAAYFGVMLGYWGGQFDLETPTNRNWKNYAILTLRGMFIALPVVITLGGAGWGGILGGALLVPYYLLGIPLARRIKLPLLHGFSEFGELFLGLSIAIGILWTS